MNGVSQQMHEYEAYATFVEEYIQRVDRLEEVPDVIFDEYDVDTESWAEKAFFIHQVISEVAYESRHESFESREFRDPKTIIEEGGNCQEQSVLLASLLTLVDITVLVVGLEGSDVENHLSLYCGAERNEESIAELVNLAYEHTELTENDALISEIYQQNGLGFSGGTEVQVFCCDPVMSNWIGDSRALEQQGYLQTLEDGYEWQCDVTAYNLQTEQFIDFI